MRFKKNNNGHILDTETNLVWCKDQSQEAMTWEEAKAYCESKGKGWRLPTIKEFQTILDYDRSTPVLPEAFSSVVSTSYWSSTTYVNYTDYAWYVDLDDGYVYNDNKTNNNYVWPVRDKLLSINSAKKQNNRLN